MNREEINNKTTRETYKITIENQKDQETQIKVKEYIPYYYSNWEIIKTTHDYEKINANEINFNISAPKGKTEIIYTVEFRRI